MSARQRNSPTSAWSALPAISAPDQSELQLAGRRLRNAADRRQRHCGEPDQSRLGSALGLQPRRTDRAVLRQGDFGSIEFGATCRRYTSTIGRQFVLGSPTARMRELYDVVRRARTP